MKINQPITLAGMTLSNALMNGAYIGSKSVEDVDILASSASGAVVVGSITCKQRTSNPDGGYWQHKERFYSLNSYGMPNGGLPYFKENLPAMVEMAHSHGKPLIANVAGFTKDEFVQLTKLAQESGADMVELNFGCPNVWDGGQQKRIISYHASLVEDTLNHIGEQNFKVKLCVKLSPLPPDILLEVAGVIGNSGIIQAVTATNSYPNSSPTTGTKQGSLDAGNLAGLSGRALKPISLGVVRQLYDVLPQDIDIIGCGGISSASDVKDYLEAGAKAVQIATALVDEGTSVFKKILT